MGGFLGNAAYLEPVAVELDGQGAAGSDGTVCIVAIKIKIDGLGLVGREHVENVRYQHGHDQDDVRSPNDSQAGEKRGVTGLTQRVLGGMALGHRR